MKVTKCPKCNGNRLLEEKEMYKVDTNEIYELSKIFNRPLDLQQVEFKKYKCLNNKCKWESDYIMNGYFEIVVPSDFVNELEKADKNDSLKQSFTSGK